MTTASNDELKARVAELESALAAKNDELAAAKSERDKLRDAYQAVLLELELLKKRLFVAKAERVDVSQLELEFAQKLAELDALSKRLEPVPPWMMPKDSGAGGESPAKRKPTGRRDLRAEELPEVRIELPDVTREGKAARIGFEEAYELRWRKGGFVRVVVARVKYEDENPRAKEEPSASPTTIVTTPMPPQTFPRSMAAPSLYAHIAVAKYCDGMPLHRQQEQYLRLGFSLDRGTMSRWMEDLGNTLGSTLVAAAREHFLANAFCISTDATGVLVQPFKGDEQRKRQPCRRGHFFVQLADKDFAFFEYVPRETSEAVARLFEGFKGYVQADAKSVYDVLYPAPNSEPTDEDCTEVGCWAHGRRKFWEAAMASDAVAREALVRIQRIFENEETWKGVAPEHIKMLRNERTRPLVDAFFAWADIEYAKVKEQRGLLRTALGYFVRQREALCRFLEDGRLGLDNNASERELRRVAVGRKAWLFVGSDDHAQAAASLFTIVASAKIHGLEPERYLSEVVRVLGAWPKDRYIELCPHRWKETRTRLDPAELEAEVGWLKIPPPLT